MASFVVKNNVESLITNNPLGAGVTTLNVTAGDGSEFPSTFPFLITLWDESAYPDPTDDSGMEIVKCTGRSVDALTIVRAQEGTADVAHSLSERVAMLMTAGILNDATYGIATKIDGIETGADVTDSTNVNTAGAVMESDIKDQSFTNLLENGDFESWSDGANVAPDGWSGVNSLTIARSTDQKVGVYAALVTATASNSRIRQLLSDAVRYRSRTLTLGAWVKTSCANTLLRLADSTTGTSTTHSGSGNWEWLTTTRVIDAATNSIEVQLYPDSVDSTGNALIDGAILVEGSVCPAFSPKPLVDDGIMLHDHTPSAANDKGKTGQICWDSSYIYVCIATDTWERAAIATW